MKPLFPRFNELKEEDINFDFHLHTCQTDGEHTAEEMIAKARELKLQALAITEHIDRSSTWFWEFKNRMEKLRENEENEKEKINIFIGLEVKPLDFGGTLDLSEEMRKNAEIIIGSVHRYPDEKSELIPLKEIKNLGEKKAAEIEFKLAKGLLTARERKIDILGHPFGVYSLYYHTFPKEYMEQLLKESLKRKIAVEISTKYCLPPTFFDLLKKINPYISFGSDAHKKEEIARGFDLIKKEIIKM